MIRRIAINTGGGDAPGLNAVIRSVAVSALNRGWEVLGIRRGYEGMLESDPEAVIELDRDRVRGIFHLGGTILGTTNRGDPSSIRSRRTGRRCRPTCRLGWCSASGSSASTRWWRSAATAP